MIEMKTIMRCGHSANAIDRKTGKDCCVICIGIVAGADEPMQNQPVLEGRKAQCAMCANIKDSNTLTKSTTSITAVAEDGIEMSDDEIEPTAATVIAALIMLVDMKRVYAVMREGEIRFFHEQYATDDIRANALSPDEIRHLYKNGEVTVNLDED
jgi:hypothetical protein